MTGLPHNSEKFRSPEEGQLPVPLLADHVTQQKVPQEVGEQMSNADVFRDSIERGEVTEQQMVDYLREGIEDGDINEAFLRNFSDIMHVMVKNGIAEAAGNSVQGRKAIKLLEATQTDSRVKSVAITPIPHGALFHTNSGHLEIAPTTSYSVYGDIANSFPYKQKGDDRLLYQAQTIGHESAHARNAGIKKYTAKKYPETANEAHWSATTRYLLAHPEKAITGNLATDWHAHEEAEAQDYAAIGLRRLMKVMSYNQHEIQTLEQAVRDSYREETGGKPGHNPLDVLHKVTADKGPHQLVYGKASHAQRQIGYLGYSRSPSTEDVIDYLAEAEALAAEEPSAITAQQWLDEFRQLHGKQPSMGLREVVAERKEVVATHRKRRAKRIGATVGAVASLAALTYGAQLLKDSEDAPHKPAPSHSKTHQATPPTNNLISPSSTR